MATFNSQTVSSIISDILSEETNNIADNNAYQQFTVTAKLTSSSNSTWSVNLMFIDGMIISQDEESYGDTIYITTSVTTKDHIEITRNYRNLYISLSFKFLSTADMLYDEDKSTIVKEYRVFIKNKQDLMKLDSYRKYLVTTDDAESNNVKVSIPEQSAIMVPLFLQLIEPTLYDMRNNFVNTIIKSSTIENTIKYVASKLGAKRISLVTPDNDLSYRNLCIDPDNGSYDKIFDFLQEKYGVYRKGLNYNYSNGVLYIYPTNGYDVKTNKTLHIVNVEAKKYIGLNRVHKFKDVDSATNTYSNMYILNTSIQRSISFNEYASENFATNLAIYRDDRTINIVDFSNSTPSIPENNIIILDSNNDGMVSDTSFRLKYMKSVNNLFKATSDLTRLNFEQMLITLPSIVPFTQENLGPLPIVIGRICKLHYDSDTGIQTRNGIVGNTTYVISRQQRTKFGYTYECKLVLGVRLGISASDYSSDAISTVSV